MSKIKICPACGHKNLYTNLVCEMCSTDLSVVQPVDDIQKITDQSLNGLDKTVVEMKKFVIFAFNDIEFKVYDGEVIGRHAIGAEFFKEIMEVSRKHAKVTFSSSKAYITDLNSTNGVFINDKRIQPGAPEEITEGAELKLCSKVKLKVVRIFSGSVTNSNVQKFKEEFKENDEMIKKNNPKAEIVPKTCKNCGKEVSVSEKICPYCLEIIE